MIRQTMPDGFERCLSFTQAFDHRHTPGKEQYGQHVVDLHLALVGPQGAVSLRIFTGWTWALGQDQLHETHRHESPDPYIADGAGLSFHGRLPREEEYYSKEPYPTCEYLGTCFDHGTSFSGADRFFGLLICEGEEALFAALRQEYDEHWPSSPAVDPLPAGTC